MCYFNVLFVDCLQAFQQTFAFEDELVGKFWGGTQNREIGNEIEEIRRGLILEIMLQISGRSMGKSLLLIKEEIVEYVL